MLDIGYDDIHPILQEYYHPFKDTTFIDLVEYVRNYGNTHTSFIQDICCSGSIRRKCTEHNVDPMKLADLILKYGDVQITDNDIEYYLPHAGVTEW